MSFNQRPGIAITRLIIHETGTYNQQFRRPYNTNLDRSTLNIIQERLFNTNKIGPTTVAGIASHFVSPSPTPEGTIDIPNGWGQKRMRFCMEVRSVFPGIGSEIIENVMGYTDYDGVALSGSVDPRMIFTVNSIITERRTIERTPLGNQTHVTINDNSHVITDNSWSGVGQQVSNHRMRPEDIYSVMTRDMLPPDCTMYDERTIANNLAMKSRRANGVPASYMANILQSWKSSEADTSIGSSRGDILEAARDYSAENIASKDPLLSAISNVTGRPIGDSFSYNELMLLDPNVDNLAVVVLMSATEKATVHQAGLTADWGGSDGVTHAATILSQAIPGLLMEQGLTWVVFKTTNQSRDGVISTVVFDVRGFSDTFDHSLGLQNFIRNMEFQVLQDLSYSGAMSFEISMQIDLLGETWIKISLDGKPEVDYVTPSFCDALTVPVVTTNGRLAMSVANDFSDLMGQLRPSPCDFVGKTNGNIQTPLSSDGFGVI